MQAPPPPADQAEAEAIIPMENVSSNDNANMNRTVIAEVEAIIPNEVVSSSSRSATKEPEAIIPMEIVSSGGQSVTTTTTTTTTDRFGPQSCSAHRILVSPTAAKGYKTEAVTHVFRIAAAAAS
jgi:hypothetical protein